jgi:tetratricopeptide (TPR) repeat protein
MHAERGDYEEALSSFSRSLEKREHWQTYYNMAMIAAQQNDPTRGISLLNRALNRAGQSGGARADILAAMAEIKYRNGRREEARADAERALSYDAANTTAQLIINTLESSTPE